MPEKIQIIFLGTGSAVPTAKKNHVGIFVSYGSTNILIDCGEGIQRQFRIAKLNPCKITHLLITHWHGDHTLGIPGLLDTLNMSGYSKKLKIFGPKGTKYNLELFEKIYGKFQIDHDIKEIHSGKFVDEKGFILDTLPMSHIKPTNAFSLVIKDKLRLKKDRIRKLKLPNTFLLGKLQQGKDVIYNNKKIKSKDVTFLEKGKKVTIIMDTAPNNNSIKIAKESDVLICESSFMTDHKDIALERKHLTSNQAATIAKKAKVKKLILTHVSQRYEKNMKPILKEAKKVFKNTHLAKDFESVKI